MWGLRILANEICHRPVHSIAISFSNRLRTVSLWTRVSERVVLARENCTHGICLFISAANCIPAVFICPSISTTFCCPPIWNTISRILNHLFAPVIVVEVSWLIGTRPNVDASRTVAGFAPRMLLAPSAWAWRTWPTCSFTAAAAALRMSGRALTMASSLRFSCSTSYVTRFVATS